MVDPYLYLGPSNLLLVEPGPAEIFLNKDYMKELKRRAALMGGGPWADQGNPDNISDRDSNPFLSDAFKTLFHSLGIGPSQFASSPAVDIPWRVPQRLEAIHLSPEVLKKFAGEYVPDSPAGVSIPPIEIAADQEGLFELEGLLADRDLLFLHRFQERALDFRRRPVDFIRQHQIGKNRPFAGGELA